VLAVISYKLSYCRSKSLQRNNGSSSQRHTSISWHRATVKLLQGDSKHCCCVPTEGGSPLERTNTLYVCIQVCTKASCPLCGWADLVSWPVVWSMQRNIPIMCWCYPLYQCFHLNICKLICKRFAIWSMLYDAIWLVSLFLNDA